MGAFRQDFGEPLRFSDGSWVLSGFYSKEEALDIFSNDTGVIEKNGDDTIALDEISSDRVRFGFPPEGMVDMESGVSCWYSGAGKGRGTQPVWVYG